MPYKRHYLGAALTISVTVFTLGSTVVSASPQSILRFKLAGSDVRDGLTFVRYDAHAKYYLTAETDGNRRSYQSTGLVLSPTRSDEDVLEREGAVQRVRLPRLQSGQGVNIGDSPVGVKEKLGGLPTTTIYDRRTRQLVYTYETVFLLTHGEMVHKQMNYLATYTFRASKLRTIDYNINEPGEH